MGILRYDGTVMEIIHETNSADETRSIGRMIASTMLPQTLLCLRGDLGAGKTTLTQGLLEGFGALRPYTSPTFVIMKQYDLPIATSTGIKRIYHADAYRVDSEDFHMLGFEEWCADPQGVVILEWPERVENILPKHRKEITLKALSEITRSICIS
jgi:tRNA threonylcarbamoyladenosine biosynthesis protein TsaE